MKRKFKVLVLVVFLVFIAVFNSRFIPFNRFIELIIETNTEAVIRNDCNLPNISYADALTANSRASGAKFLLTKSMTESIKKLYEQSWDYVTTPYNPTYMIDGRDICNVVPPPFILFFVLSLPKNTRERQAIRQSWGSVAIRSIASFSICTKLIFLIGRMANDSFTDKVLQDEATQYKDIVQADVVESRHNLTTKMMSGLRWVKTHCHSVNYILKVDDDTFINVAQLSDYFLKNQNINNETIHGYVYPNGGTVMREGKYAVRKEEFPSSRYPPYISGTSYILPANVISDMIDVAERLPYCPVDDAFIAGVLRNILNLKLQHSASFTHVLDLRISPCNFHSKIAVTNIDIRCMSTLWNLTLNTGNIDCAKSLSYDKTTCSIFR